MDPLSAWVALQGAGVAILGMVRRRKTKPKNLAKHPARRLLIDCVAHHPGARLVSICEELGLNRGTAAYHLRLLEGAGILEGVSKEHRRHYFPPDFPDEMKERFLLLNRGRVLDVVLEVANDPGVIQSDLADRVGMTRKALRHHLDDLKAVRLVRERTSARAKAYYATPQLLDLLDAVDLHR